MEATRGATSADRTRPVEREHSQPLFRGSSCVFRPPIAFILDSHICVPPKSSSIRPLFRPQASRFPVVPDRHSPTDLRAFPVNLAAIVNRIVSSVYSNHRSTPQLDPMKTIFAGCLVARARIRSRRKRILTLAEGLGRTDEFTVSSTCNFTHRRRVVKSGGASASHVESSKGIPRDLARGHRRNGMGRPFHSGA